MDPDFETKLNISCDLFKSAKTFRELLRLNKKFIDGELVGTPYHLGPLESDSVTIKNDLLLLHDEGLFTVNGQPGAAGTEYGVWYEYSKKYFDHLQAPYLCFYMEKGPLADKLKRSLATQEQIKFNIWDKNGPVLSNFFEGISVTTERGAKKKKNIKHAAWEESTHIWSAHTNRFPPGRYGGELDIPLVEDSEDFIFVDTVIPEYGSSASLEQKILFFLL